MPSSASARRAFWLLVTLGGASLLVLAGLLVWQGQRLEIAEIVATWRGPGEKGFHIKTVDGAAFDLAYHEIPDEWHIQPI